MPIRTGLGTRAVLLGSVMAVAELWNFTVMNLGINKILQVLLVLALCLLLQHLLSKYFKIGVDMI